MQELWRIQQAVPLGKPLRNNLKPCGSKAPIHVNEHCAEYYSSHLHPRFFTGTHPEMSRLGHTENVFPNLVHEASSTIWQDKLKTRVGWRSKTYFI